MGKAERNFTIGFIAYVLIAIFTFGYAASHSNICVGRSVDLCNNGDRAAAGLAAGLMWPFYWSWEAWA